MAGSTTDEMKRIGRIVGLLGGLAALAWAMRDRFVSIASPREPKPPAFRVVSTPPPPPTERPAANPGVASDLADGAIEPDDLTQINGVGPVFERRLMEAGLPTFTAISDAQPQQVADAAGITEQRAESWITQAKILASR